MKSPAILLTALLAGTFGAAGQETNSTPRTGVDAFRIIYERNIFNQNRSGRRPWSENRETQREPERRVRVESLALLGTMSYEKGRFAFFDGSSSDYRKVLEPSDHIAGFTITEVSSGHVKLSTTNGPAIDLPVGMRLERHDDSNWQLAMNTERSESSDRSRQFERSSRSDRNDRGDRNDRFDRSERRSERSSSPEPSSTASSSTSGSPAPAASAQVDESEILKKLMQKREQELQR